MQFSLLVKIKETIELIFACFLFFYTVAKIQIKH